LKGKEKRHNEKFLVKNPKDHRNYTGNPPGICWQINIERTEKFAYRPMLIF
jgi:hypothetical protein